MLFSLLYMVLRGVLRLAPAGDERDREAEILVLRHQVKVLKRKACPKGTQTSDRAQAASSYSWMRPPNTSLLRMRAPEACGAGSGRGPEFSGQDLDGAFGRCTCMKMAGEAA